ncbi:T9SS type A sorting domain-containing protein [candidate division WOR-3 bacterium]|nr:T9SS type A sorting domain-containing protein [candidate division WOR-3 bacterium]
MFKKLTKMFIISVIAILAISALEAGTWQTKASMPTARRGPAGAEASSKIYVIGGCGGQGRKNEEYNPSTNSWATKAPLPQPRRRGMGAVAGEVSGKIYFIGGHQGPPPGQTVNFNDEYNPVTNSWTIKASMSTPREGAACGVVDGKIYVIGGYDGTNFLNSVEVYNPGTNFWSTKASMPSERAFIASAVVDGKIYVIGGHNGTSPLNTVEVYNPSTNSWLTKASMPTTRYWLAADAVGEKIYATGGFDGADYLNIVEEYDPGTNSWSTDTPMPTSRSHLTAVEVNGKIYAIGGVIAGGSFTNKNEEFIPSTGIDEEKSMELSKTFSLIKNSPDPFNSYTNIEYTLGTDCEVKLEVYNAIGKKMATLVNQKQSAGYHRVQWKTKVPSGIYFLRIEAREFSEIQKMVITK